MFIHRLTISHKVLSVIIAGIIIAASFAGMAVLMGKRQTNTLKKIHFNDVKPLNNLRKIQLVFKEVEFRMVGVQAEVTTPTAAGNHLEESLKTIGDLWNEVEESLPDIGERDNFKKGFKGFSTVAPRLKEAYFNEEKEKVEYIYDEWLDYKPLVMKSIDKFASVLTEEVENNYIENQGIIKRLNTVIVIIAFSVIAFFITVELFIIRSINRPINTVVDAAGQTAAGDLTCTINAMETSAGNRTKQSADLLRQATKKSTGSGKDSPHGPQRVTLLNKTNPEFRGSNNADLAFLLPFIFLFPAPSAFP